MKRLFLGILVPFLVVACDRKEPTQVETPAVTVTEPPPPTAVPVTPAEAYGVAEEEPTNAPEIEEVPVTEPPAPTPGERLDHGLQKTEEGLRKAAEATGAGLRRLGETIERKAEEQSR
jgi:hypothetical protein